MPYALCWRSGDRKDYTLMKNRAFPSWHFARLNQQLHDDYLEEYSPGRFLHKRPLLCCFHSPDLDPTLPVVLKYLCCVARVVLAEAESANGDSGYRHLHLWNLRGGAEGKLLIYAKKTHDGSPGIIMDFDQAYDMSTHDNRIWTLLPVYIFGRSKARGRWCVGLVLLRRRRGGFVRKGTFHCREDSSSCGLRVLLKALEMARPSFIMIS
jgi:hypothetical protein